MSLNCLPLAKKLAVAPKRVLKYLLLPLGSKVEIGQAIALKSTLMGLKKKVIKSPVKGKLLSYSEETGELIIETDNDRVEQPIQKGKKEKEVEAAFGFGKGQGKSYFLENETVSLADLVNDFNDKIVFCQQIESLAVLYKLAAMGATGAVIFRLEDNEKEELITKVRERIEMAVLALKNNQDLKKIRKSFENKELLVDGERKVLCLLG